MKNCIFCKILTGEIPSEKIYEDQKTYVFLDASPIAIGHMLVIPKKHYETMDEMDPKTANAVIKTTQKIGRTILKFNKGYNVNQNNKPTAGQVVPHVHYHLIPRNNNDDLKFSWKNIKFDKKYFQETKTKIQKFLK